MPSHTPAERRKQSGHKTGHNTPQQGQHDFKGPVKKHK